MATLRFLKTLKNPDYNVLQLLTSYVFGDRDIRPHDPNKTYSKGDMIIRVNGSTNKLEVLQCNAIEIGGAFVESDWTKYTVNQIIGGATVNDKLVIVSDVQPSEPSNLVWYQLVTPKEGVDAGKITTSSILVFSAEQFAGQDDAPTDPDVKIWFDYEQDPVQP